MFLRGFLYKFLVVFFLKFFRVWNHNWNGKMLFDKNYLNVLFNEKIWQLLTILWKIVSISSKLLTRRCLFFFSYFIACKIVNLYIWILKNKIPVSFLFMYYIIYTNNMCLFLGYLFQIITEEGKKIVFFWRILYWRTQFQSLTNATI